MPANLENLAVATGLKKASFHSNLKEGQCQRIINYGSIALISNPLQYSCLENPRDRGAWWATIYGVAQSRTRLKRLSSSSSRSDRMPDEPWTEGRDTVLETGTKTIPMEKKNAKKAKWLSEEGLQIAVKRREGKSKGEKIYSFECRVPTNSKER